MGASSRADAVVPALGSVLIRVMASPIGGVGPIIMRARELGFKGRVIHAGLVDRSVRVARGRIGQRISPWRDSHQRVAVIERTCGCSIGRPR